MFSVEPVRQKGLCADSIKYFLSTTLVVSQAIFLYFNISHNGRAIA